MAPKGGPWGHENNGHALMALRGHYSLLPRAGGFLKSA